MNGGITVETDFVEDFFKGENLIVEVVWKSAVKPEGSVPVKN